MLGVQWKQRAIFDLDKMQNVLAFEDALRVLVQFLEKLLDHFQVLDLKAGKQYLYTSARSSIFELLKGKR